MIRLREIFSSKNPATQRTLLTKAAFVLGFVLLGVIAIQVWGYSNVVPVAAQPAQFSPLAQGIDNETCLACHNTPGLRITLPSGEFLYLTVDREVYASSVHGQLGYACVQCHTDISSFPHRPLMATTRRQFTLQLYRSCAECHQNEYGPSWTASTKWRWQPGRLKPRCAPTATALTISARLISRAVVSLRRASFATRRYLASTGRASTVQR